MANIALVVGGVAQAPRTPAVIDKRFGAGSMNTSFAQADRFTSFRALCMGIVVLILAGCGGSSSPDQGPQQPDPDPVATATITGVAATGAPIDGATVSAIDANGDAIDLTDAATGADGRYAVDIPLDSAFPILLRVTAADGSVLTTIVSQAPTMDGEEVTAHVNPITDLVASELIDTATDDAAELATALAGLGEGEPGATGDEVLADLLGASVPFERFASDADFVAKTEDGPGSVADAVLDVIGERAREAGQDLGVFLAALHADDVAPKLLEAPSFQVALLADRIRDGIEEPEDLGAELRSFGALSDDPSDPADDVFETLVASLPGLLAEVREQAGMELENPQSIATAVAAAARVLGETLQARRDRFGDDDAALVDLVAGETLRAAVSDLMTSTLVPVLRELQGSMEDAQTSQALAAVSQRVAREAALALSSLDLSRTDVDAVEVARRFTAERLAGVNAETIAAIAGGTSTLDEVVPRSSDVRDVQQAMREIIAADPSLGDENLVALAQGRWNEDRWNEFVWQ